MTDLPEFSTWRIKIKGKYGCYAFNTQGFKLERFCCSINCLLTPAVRASVTTGWKSCYLGSTCFSCLISVHCIYSNHTENADQASNAFLSQAFVRLTMANHRYNKNCIICIWIRKTPPMKWQQHKELAGKEIWVKYCSIMRASQTFRRQLRT